MEDISEPREQENKQKEEQLPQIIDNLEQPETVVAENKDPCKLIL